MIKYVAYFIIAVGVGFNLMGCFGLIRFPDFYTRLQASTKSVTLGTGGILLGVFLMSGFSAAGVKALLCIVFLLMTAPVAAHSLARAAHKSGVKLWEKSVCDEYEKQD